MCVFGQILLALEEINRFNTDEELFFTSHTLARLLIDQPIPILRRLRYFVHPLRASGFPECEGRIRDTEGNCSRYLTGFASLFHHWDSGESVRF